MKKLFVVLCAVAALGLAACHKDNPQPSEVGDGRGGQQQDEIPAGDGVFNPDMRITSVVYDDDRLPEIWLWQDGKLQSINNDDNCGGYTPVSTFVYNGWRVASMTSSQDGLSYEAYYSYVGDKLSEVTAFAGNIEAVDIVFGHNTEGKIDHMSLNVNNTLLNWVLQMFGGGAFKSTASRLPQSKMSVDTTAFDIDLDWQGDNVSRMYFTGSLMLNVTLAEIAQIVDLDSLFGDNASLLAMIDQTAEMPLQVTINDTVSYTYDNQHNPFCGFLGAMDPANLSTNNATAVTTTGSVTFTFTVSTFIGTVYPAFPMSLPSETMVYSYTYNNNGYPLTVTDSEGSETEYAYE